jgi:hypothetical protein
LPEEVVVPGNAVRCTDDNRLHSAEAKETVTREQRHMPRLVVSLPVITLPGGRGELEGPLSPYEECGIHVGFDVPHPFSFELHLDASGVARWVAPLTEEKPDLFPQCLMEHACQSKARSAPGEPVTVGIPLRFSLGAALLEQGKNSMKHSLWV